MTNILNDSKLLTLMGVEPNDFDNATRRMYLDDITSYFKGKKNAEKEMLRVLAKDTREDRVEAMWIWTKLRKEQEEKIRFLDPQDFTPDIEAELKAGFLTKEKMDEIQRSVAEMQDKGVFTNIKTDAIKENVDALQQVTEELEKYG